MSDARTDAPQPGPDNTSPPPGAWVFRLPREPRPDEVSPEALTALAAGQALPNFFNLSSADKGETVPHVSTWCEGLTTVAEAWVLAGARPANKYLVRLPVDDVRAIDPLLDVRWFRATTTGPDGARIHESRPGWEGHCGVTGWTKAMPKEQWRFLRSRLVDLATRTGVRLLTSDEMPAPPAE